MNPAGTWRALGWMIRDTFRQSLAYRVFWILLATSLLCTLVCSSVRIEGAKNLALDGENADFLPQDDPEAVDAEALRKSGVAVISGQVTLGWGLIQVPLARDARSAVHFLELVLGAGVAGTLGLLLTLVWTAGFLPGFLDPRAISVLLAKPGGRAGLLVGKYVGVLTFVLFHATLLVSGTWLALGARTGIWDWPYLWSIPLLLLQFAVFFSFSVLLAVCTRSTVTCVFGSILFWCLSWGMNFGHHAMLCAGYDQEVRPFSSKLEDLAGLCYWVLPKPADVSILVYDALDAGASFGRPAILTNVIDHGDFHPLWSVIASLAFACFVLVASARHFRATDY